MQFWPKGYKQPNYWVTPGQLPMIACSVSEFAFLIEPVYILTNDHLIPAMNEEEKALVTALHRGDRYACNDLVEQYSSRIYNVALKLTGHPTEAEEILQETFINACRGAGNFEGRSSLGTWLYRIATNNGLMRLRRREAPTVPLDVPPDVEDGGEFWPRQLHDWH